MTDGPLVLAGSGWHRLLRGPDWIRWLAIFLFLALGIGLRSPWPADEPRFALAAMDMLLNDHWLLPHRGGEIYADKPPLFMWLQALFFAMTGNMRTAFLLPSLVASMATLWLVHDLTRRLFGREQAWYAVLLLVVTVQFIVQAKSAQIDATLCAFTTLGIYGLMRHHVLGPRGAWNAIAWLAMGCAIITKGVGFLPVFVLPGLLAARRIGRNTAANSAVSPATRRSEYLVPLMILLPVLLWLAPLFFAAYVEGRADVAAYLQEILFRQTVTRYADGLGHFKPGWYYLTNVIPGLWMPLSVLFLWLIPDWVRRLRQFSLPHWALLGFVVLSLAFFSLSPGKRGVYMLPLLPPLAVVAGAGMPALVRRMAAIRTMRTIALLLGALLILAAVVTWLDAGSLAARLDREEIDRLPALLLLFALGVTWLAVPTIMKSGGAYPAAMVVTWLLFSTGGYALLDPARSAEGLMADVSARLTARDQLAIVDFEEQQILQADRPVTHWGFDDDRAAQVADAVAWLREAGGRYVLIPESASVPCLGSEAGVWLGYRHRRDWRLVAASDIQPGVECAANPRDATRFQAPFVGYPGGPGG